MSQFTGFSEEDLKRIKSSGKDANENAKTTNIKSITVSKRQNTPLYKYKSVTNQRQDSDDAIDSMDFQKCKLSLKTPPLPIETSTKKEDELTERESVDEDAKSETSENSSDASNNKNAPDIVRGVNNYNESEEMSHDAKLVQLHFRQKIIEEQNKKRKEMLAKVLANRTKQTEEEVMKLEKIKKELQVLDGQFTKDVSVLRKKIDQSCLSYANAEKQYLRVEKEFLQAKIQLQKEKEKKELLTEHLCALITHNETRKAQKLETLMLELAEKKEEEIAVPNYTNDVVIDGVEESTGKMVEFSTNKS